MKKIFLTILTIVFFTTQAFATTYYGCTENSGVSWNSTTGAYWVTTTGAQAACTSGVVAGTGNALILNSSSGTGTWTETASFSEASLNLTGNPGTLALGTNVMTITGLLTLAGALSATSPSNASGAFKVGGGITLAATPTGTTFPQIELTASQTLTSNGFLYPGVIDQYFTGAVTLTLSGNANINYLKMDMNNVGIETLTFAGAYNATIGTLETNSSTGYATTLVLVSGQTYTVTNALKLNGSVSNNATTNPLIEATTTSTAALTYSGTTANEGVYGMNFTYINATGSTGGGIYNYFGGALSNTSGITNVTAANIGGSSTASRGYIYGS